MKMGNGPVQGAKQVSDIWPLSPFINPNCQKENSFNKLQTDVVWRWVPIDKLLRLGFFLPRDKQKLHLRIIWSESFVWWMEVRSGFLLAWLNRSHQREDFGVLSSNEGTWSWMASAARVIIGDSMRFLTFLQPPLCSSFMVCNIRFSERQDNWRKMSLAFGFPVRRSGQKPQRLFLR